MAKRSLNPIYHLVFSIGFVGLLLIPLRTLNLSPDSIEEEFYGRSFLIQAATNLRVAIGDRVFPKAIIGDDGWLVYTAENDIEDYQNANLFTDEELARIQTSLDRLTSTYAERGKTLLVVIAPDKNSIYPERVPNKIPVFGEESALDQLVSYLHEHGTAQILDLRPALLAAKDERQIYYATDTHWNDYGAFVAYNEILSALGKTFPNLQAHPEGDFKVTTSEPDLLDLSENIGTTLLRESKIQFVPQFDSDTNYKTVNVGGRRIQFSTNSNADLPTAIVYHDSFFFRVIPFLGEHFSSAMYIQNYMGGGLWNLSWVDERRPGIVIIEFTERYLHDLPLLIDPGGE
jgi:alginate O-acetyltransferase complex protein AlgJ